MQIRLTVETNLILLVKVKYTQLQYTKHPVKLLIRRSLLSGGVFRSPKEDKNLEKTTVDALIHVCLEKVTDFFLLVAPSTSFLKFSNRIDRSFSWRNQIVKKNLGEQLYFIKTP